jgi:hypothetical protein
VFAGQQEVGMQRMHGPVGGDGLVSRQQRLTQYLAAEHIEGADVVALSLEMVVPHGLELHQAQELF